MTLVTEEDNTITGESIHNTTCEGEKLTHTHSKSQDGWGWGGVINACNGYIETTPGYPHQLNWITRMREITTTKEA